MFKRVCSFVLVLAMLLAMLPVDEVQGFFRRAFADDTIPEPIFQLPESEIAEEHVSGGWRYALREDGFAVITGYEGVFTEGTVPYALDGYYVVEIAENALPDAQRVALHVNIMDIADSAFGESLQEITSPNGSFGLYWAAQHSITYSTGKDYDLVPGVIDFTDRSEHVRKRGEEYVVFDKPEGLQLTVGSIFFMRDGRGMEFFYRVTELTEDGGQIVASVVIPEIKDAIVNYETEMEIALTEDDFIPAEGVTVEKSAVSAKTVSTLTDENEFSIHGEISAKPPKSGNNESTSWTWKGEATGSIKNTVSYTITIRNGVVEASELTKSQTYSLKIKGSCKGQENMLKQYAEARKELNKDDPKEIDKSFLRKVFEHSGLSSISPLDWNHEFNAEDVNSLSDILELWEKTLKEKSKIQTVKELGAFTFQTPYFNFRISVALNLSISGSIEYEYSNTNITKEQYNKATDDWEVVYSNGNASSNSSGHELKLEIEGRIALEVEMSIGVLFTSNLSISFQFGLSAKATKVISYRGNLTFGCTDASISPFASITVYGGVWVGKSTGVKVEIYSREWTAQDLMGKPYLWHAHINLALENKVHAPDACPLNDRYTVTYETKTGTLINQRTVGVDKLLTKNYNVTPDGAGDDFLGWAYNMNDKEPTAALAGRPFKDKDTGIEQENLKLTGSITLYAVWKNSFEVTFDSNGGTEIASQWIPAGGYITPPKRPSMDNGIFDGWFWTDQSGIDHEWDFEKDTVSGNMTLTAKWAAGGTGGTGNTNGTEEAFYIGDITTVSEDCLYNPNHQLSSSAYYLKYELFEYEDMKGAVITGIKNDPVHLVIPEELPNVFATAGDESTLPVVDIKSGAFSNCKSLRSVYFLCTNQYDTGSLFSGCSNLEYVELPALDEGILDSSSFSGCGNLRCIKMPVGAKEIKSSAFYNCSGLTGTLTIPDGVTSIEASAFYGCSGLTSIVVPDSVNSIGQGAFSYCSNLEELSVPFIGCTPDNITDYQLNDIFHSWYNSSKTSIPATLKTITITNASTIPYEAFQYCYNVEHIIVPNKVTSIGAYAFSSCSSLKEFTLPDSLQTIGSYAFYNRSNIKGNLVIPDGVTSIGSYAFYGCSGLTGTLIIPDGVTSIGNSVFYGCSGLTGTLTIPDGVTSIENSAFYNCSGLTGTLIIPDGVTSIGASAFYGCSGLTSIVVPDSVNSIGQGAFSYCSNLEELSVPFIGCTPDNITDYQLNDIFHSWYNSSKTSIPATLKTITITNASTIPYEAFQYCYNVEHIIVPNKVTSIGAYAFSSCSSLKEFTLPDSLQTIGSYAFYNRSNIKGDLVIPDGVTSIGSYAFYGCSGLTGALIIPDGVTSIGNSVFYGCSGLTGTLTIPDGVTSIENSAFYNCSGLTGTLIIPDGVTSIGASAFYNCSGLTSIVVPDSVTSIGQGAFRDCSNLKELTVPFVGCTPENGGYFYDIFYVNIYGTSRTSIPATLKTITITDANTIPYEAFQYCYNVEHIIVPNKVTSIGAYAFSSCSSLKEFTLPDSLQTIGSYAFYNRSNIKGDLVIPDGVTSIGSYAFYGCSGLTGTLIIPDGVTSIGNSVFYGCSGLTGTLTIPDGVTIIENSAFYNCSGLTGTLIIPDGVTSIGASAFYNCIGLTSIVVPDSVTSIGQGAFRDCSNLEELTVPFVGCTPENGGYFYDIFYVNIYGTSRTSIPATLKTITITDANTIPYGAFQHCYNVEHIIVPDKVTSIEAYAFSGCNRLKDLDYLCINTIPSSDAFSGCSSLLTVHLPGRNAELEAYLDSKGISYNFPIGTEYTLTLFMNENERTQEQHYWQDDLELPEPIWEGHRFSGWYQDAETTQKWVGSTMPGRDLTLYAGWDMNFYTLTLHINGETVQEQYYWQDPLALPTPTWEGHYFSGWYQDAETTQKWVGSTMPGRDLTLYAGWDKNLYTLTIVSENGNVEMRVPAGEVVNLTAPTKEGFFFTGWYLDEECTIAFDGIMGYNDLTIYEGWKPVSDHARFRIDGDHVVLLEYLLQEDDGDAVYLPNEVYGLPLTTIAAGAFSDSDVEAVYIPASVTDIETGAFRNSGIRTLYVQPENPAYQVIKGILYSKDGTKLVFCPSKGRTVVRVPKGVTAIGDYAFADSSLTTLTLPEGLKTIGDHAFSGTRLTEVTLPETVERIEQYAFYHCRKLYNVTALGSPAAVEKTSFLNCFPFMACYGPEEDCPFRTVMKSLGCWYNCHSFTLNLPGSTKTLILPAGSQLLIPEKPEMPENTEFTGWYQDEACTAAFTGNTMPNADLTLWPGSRSILLTQSGDNGITIVGCQSENAVITIPETIGGISVTAIASGAFGSDYREIQLPASVTEIEEGAFAAGTNLVCVPGSFAAEWAREHGFTTEARSWKLSYVTECRELEPIQLKADDKLLLPELIRDGYALTGWFDEAGAEVTADTLMGASDRTIRAVWELTDSDAAERSVSFAVTEENGQLTITGYNGSGGAVTIPETINGLPVTGIAAYAFAFQNTVTELTIPNTVTEIGKSAFTGMRSLATAVWPESVTEIPQGAFADCSSLTEIRLPDTLEQIRKDAFARTGFETITLPAGLIRIDAAALSGCTALQSIQVEADSRFYESRDGVLFDIADSVLVKYPAAKPGDSYTVSNVSSIGDWAFENANQLKTIELSEDVWPLGKGAFSGCSGLKELPQLSSWVYMLPANCFSGCVGLKDIELPASIKKLEENAFAGCHLGTITVSDQLTAIGARAIDTDTIVYGSSDCYAKSWCNDNGLVFRTIGTIAPQSLYAEDMTLQRGERQQVVITAEPSEADLSQLRITVTNPSVAYVDETGIVYALAGGSTGIYITDPAGATTSCLVTVEVAAQSVSIAEETLKLSNLQTQATLTARILPDSATNKALTWVSSDEKVAAVDENGVVTLVSSGTAVITATTHNGLQASVTVTCELLAEGITLDQTEITLCMGESCQLKYHLLPEGATASVSWSSSANAASVTQEGLVTGIANGTARITAQTDTGASASCTVTVKCDLTEIQSKLATCTEPGNSTYYSCSKCGCFYITDENGEYREVEENSWVIPATGHEEVIDQAVGVTCTESGLTEGKHCNLCGEVLVVQVVLPAPGHKEVTDEAVEATCAEDGKTEGSHCETCGEVFVAQQTIPATGQHTPQQLEGRNPTCTEDGLTAGEKCSVCGKILQAQEPIPAPGHKIVTDPGVDASCTKDGLTEGKHCDVCGEVIVPQETIDALGHKEEVIIPGKEATCTEDGLLDKKVCFVCKEVTQEQKTIPATGHDPVHKEPQKATLEEDGYRMECFVCSNCKACFKDESGEVAAEADCVIPAVKTVKLSSTRYSYNGKTKTPKVGVYDSAGNKLVRDRDYTVTYAKGRKAVGQYNVTMKGTGDYDFRTTLTFKILPPKSAVYTPKALDNGFTVKWVKKTSQVTGYQLQYSLKKDFSDAVTVTIKSNTTVSKSVKKLKNKKTYYVRIRTYKVVGSSKFYSSWSAAKKVKTK